MKLFRIEIQSFLYSAPAFVLARDLDEAWGLLVADAPGEDWRLEKVGEGLYLAISGKVSREVKVVEVDTSKSQVLR